MPIPTLPAVPSTITPLGVVDDGQGRTIFDRAPRIEKFGFAVDVATGDVRGRAKPDQRRIANAFQKAGSNIHCSPHSLLFCFLASVRNGNFNGVCADFGNFIAAWHACSARHPLAGNNLRSSSDQEKNIRLSSRTMASESSRNTRSPLATRTSLRAPHRAAEGLSRHFAAAQRPRRFRSTRPK